MLISPAEKKIGECVVCYHRCSGFLMELASTTSYMVRLECGVLLVVYVKKGKVSVFDNNRSEEELVKYCDRVSIPRFSIHLQLGTFRGGDQAEERQEILGYSNIGITMNLYVHITEDKKQ